MTHSIMIVRIMTKALDTVIITLKGIMTHSIMTVRIMTICIMTVSKMTDSKMPGNIIFF